MAGSTMIKRYLAVAILVLSITLVFLSFRNTSTVFLTDDHNEGYDHYDDIAQLEKALSESHTRKLQPKVTFVPHEIEKFTTPPIIIENKNVQHKMNLAPKDVKGVQPTVKAPASKITTPGLPPKKLMKEFAKQLTKIVSKDLAKVENTAVKGSKIGDIANQSKLLKAALKGQQVSSTFPSPQIVSNGSLPSQQLLPSGETNQIKIQKGATDIAQKNAIRKEALSTTAPSSRVNAANQQQPNTLPTAGTQRLDATVDGWNYTIASLDVTALFKPDDKFKNVKDFTIEELVPFFSDGGIHRNSDNSTFENWLAMSFPPNAVWDPSYKTPCYTDYVSGRFRCIPQIYMVGWAKSGTTDMWWYLKKHPEMVDGWKETQFLTQFSFWEDHKTMKTYDELLRYFFDQRSNEKQKEHPELTMFDATATIIYDNWHWRIKQGYMGDPHIPTHTNFHYLRKIHPGAQIVVMMRNPTTRALSFYNHGIDMSAKKNANLQFVYKDMPKSPVDIHKFFVDSIYYFNECVNRTSLRACCHMSGWESQDWGDPKYFMTLRIGVYYIFLEEVYKNYPTSQVHLVKSEEFYQSPHTALNSLFTFLNKSTTPTDDLVKKKGDYIIMKIKKYFQPLVETYRLLQKFYAPFNKRLAAMLNDQRWLEWETELVGITAANQG